MKNFVKILILCAIFMVAYFLCATVLPNQSNFVILLVSGLVASAVDVLWLDNKRPSEKIAFHRTFNTNNL